jgi:hypothetical protein
MVGLGRFELPTYGLGNQRSIHLSYSPEIDTKKVSLLSGVGQLHGFCTKHSSQSACGTLVAKPPAFTRGLHCKRVVRSPLFSVH